MPQDCKSMQSKQQANEAPWAALDTVVWGLLHRSTRRNDFAKWVGYDKGRWGRHKCPSGSGSQTRTMLRHHTPPLVVAFTLGLTITLGDLTGLATLISARSISWATFLSLHFFGGVRPNPQILYCFLPFSISPMNVVHVLAHTKCTHHLTTPYKGTAVIFLCCGTRSTIKTPGASFIKKHTKNKSC